MRIQTFVPAIACILGLLAPSLAASAAPLSPASSSVRAAVDAAVQHERTVYGGKTPVPGVLIGVWDKAGHSYIRGYGYADIAKRVPMSAADHFRIGSNTKTFVISVILQLIDEGKFTLDTPLSHFSLGVTVPNAKNITVRQLCDMRSGLFESYDTPEVNAAPDDPNAHFDPRTLIEWAVKQKPYFAPNKGYRYSNTNYLLLGLIIEAVTKDTVADQIHKRLLVPFHLTNTSYPDSQAMAEPWAHGYGLDKNDNWEDVSNTVPVSLMGAAGNMISTLADSKRWVDLWTTGKTSAAATQRARMHCIPIGQGNLAFGLGVGCSAGWFGYTGGLPGYNTANYYNPSTGVTIVAWVTLQRATPGPGVANAIFRAIAHAMQPAQPIPFSTKGETL